MEITQDMMVEWARNNPYETVEIKPFYFNLMAETLSYNKSVDHYLLEDGTPLEGVVSDWYRTGGVVTQKAKQMVTFTAQEMQHVPSFMNFMSCRDGKTIIYSDRQEYKTEVKYTPIQRTYAICTYLFDMFPNAVAIVNLGDITDMKPHMLETNGVLVEISVDPFVKTEYVAITKYGTGLTENELSKVFNGDISELPDVLCSLQDGDIGSDLWQVK